MVSKSHVCPKCQASISYTEDADLYEVVADHIAHCPGAPLSTKAHRITDVVSPEVMKGNIINIDDILGQEVLVTGITWRESTMKEDAEYLSLTLDMDGVKKVLNTGAERVVAIFRTLLPADLPIYCAFEKIQLPNGRRVYHCK